jgi:hypothetical protein
MTGRALGFSVSPYAVSWSSQAHIEDEQQRYAEFMARLKSTVAALIVAVSGMPASPRHSPYI